MCVAGAATVFSLVLSRLALIGGEVWVTGGVLFLGETGLQIVALEGWMCETTGSSFLHLCS